MSAIVTKPTILTMDDLIVMSENKFSFSENMKTNMTQTIITDKERMTMGQNTKKPWFNFRKRVIIASKAQDVLKKIKKVNMGIKVDMWSLYQSISGLTFVNPDRSPDRTVQSLCCPPAYLEIKSPFSIDHTTPQDLNISLPYIKKNLNEEFVIN